MRVGIGYDSHRFDPARPLVLGGVAIPDALHPAPKEQFDRDVMAMLFETGRNCGLDGGRWNDRPPGVWPAAAPGSAVAVE